MAISFVQSAHTGTTNTSTFAITLGAATTAGNLVVVTVGYKNSTPQVNGIATVVDDHSESFTKVTSSSSGGPNSDGFVEEIWYLANTTGGSTTITMTTAGTMFTYIISIVYEFSGAATSSVLDTSSGLFTNSNATSSMPGPSLTASVAGELLVEAGVNTDAVGTGGADGIWTDLIDSSVQGYVAGYTINPPLSAQNATFPCTGGVTVYAASGASFLPPGGGGVSKKQKASTELIF